MNPDTAVDLDSLLRRLDIGPNDRSQISNAEARFLFDFVRLHDFQRTLEIGCGLGKSAVAIMSATGDRHVVIDPFQENYEHRGLDNIERAGLTDRLEFMPEPSHSALPRLLDQGRRFDFVFIDGGHRFDQIFVDFYYSDLLLEPNGFIVFDDLWMRTARLVLAFIRKNRPDYTELAETPRTVAVVQKTGVDHRDGMSHREFYTPRSLASHRANLWLATGQDTALKRAAKRLKSRVLA